MSKIDDDDQPLRPVMTPALALGIIHRVRDAFEEDDAGETRTMPPLEREKLESCIDWLATELDRARKGQITTYIDPAKNMIDGDELITGLLQQWVAPLPEGHTHPASFHLQRALLKMAVLRPHMSAPLLRMAERLPSPQPLPYHDKQGSSWFSPEVDPPHRSFWRRLLRIR